MGLPMVLSMVLQALYNVVDTIFVVNMGDGGSVGNIALSAAFPAQIFMIAVGVGTGVGINAALSARLGEGDKESASKVVGNGMFLVALFYAVFLLFGLFLVEPYMRLTSADEQVVATGCEYLRICCCLSFGSIGFAVAERYLIATGKTLFSMISQVTGAVINIVLDYVFIYPLKMGVAGAAYATVIGQIASFALAVIFHCAVNPDLRSGLKRVKPELKILKGVYRIGFPAFLMQGMLSLMMFGVLLIIGGMGDAYAVNLLSGSFGIYYKLMQAALFASFGLSNTLITVSSFNFGLKAYDRVKQTAFYGIVITVIITFAIACVYRLFAEPVSRLFALTAEETAIVDREDVIKSCLNALRIATIGYPFMGFSVAIQGVLQGVNDAYSPLIISALRLIVFPLPLCYVFVRTAAATSLIWLSFPLSEVLTAVAAYLLMRCSLKKRLATRCE